MNSRVLWRDIVDDLLAYSPNIAITHLMRTSSTADLIALCDRHRRTAQWLNHHSHDPTPVPEDCYTSFRLPPNLKDAHLLPGLSYMVGVFSDGSICIFSAEIGEVTWSWTGSPTSQLEHVQVNVCLSEQHGTMVMVVGDLACTYAYMIA
jgi:hypothetical protein